MSTSGAPSSATHGWPRTTPSTRSATARRCGCRSSVRTNHFGTPCTSTCPSLASTSRRAWERRLPREAASSTTPMPRRGGSSPTAPATACVSPRGPTGPCQLPRSSPEPATGGPLRAGLLPAPDAGSVGGSVFAPGAGDRKDVAGVVDVDEQGLLVLREGRPGELLVV